MLHTELKVHCSKFKVWLFLRACCMLVFFWMGCVEKVMLKFCASCDGGIVLPCIIQGLRLASELKNVFPGWALPGDAKQVCLTTLCFSFHYFLSLWRHSSSYSHSFGGRRHKNLSKSFLVRPIIPLWSTCKAGMGLWNSWASIAAEVRRRTPVAVAIPQCFPPSPGFVSLSAAPSRCLCARYSLGARAGSLSTTAMRSTKQHLPEFI